MMKGLGGLMKQAQKMQEEMANAQKEIAKIQVEGQSGGGLVKLTMTGKHQVLKVNIDDSLVGDDKDMLEDLVAAAVNDATNKITAQTKDKYTGLAGGIDLPGGMQMPF